jgi:hypothetical protein
MTTPAPAASGVYVAGIPIGSPLMVDRAVTSKPGAAEAFSFTSYTLSLLTGRSVTRVEYRDADLCTEHLAALQAGGSVPVAPYASKDGRSVYYRGRKPGA